MLGAVRHAVSAIDGLKVVMPGLVVTIPVVGSTLTPTWWVLIITGTTFVGTLTLPGLVNGSRPTIAPG